MFFRCKSEFRELYSIRSLACIFLPLRVPALYNLGGGGGCDLRFLLILYLNEATAGAFFMSFGSLFQKLIVEGRRNLRIS